MTKSARACLSVIALVSLLVAGCSLTGGGSDVSQDQSGGPKPAGGAGGSSHAVARDCLPGLVFMPAAGEPLVTGGVAKVTVTDTGVSHECEIGIVTMQRLPVVHAYYSAALPAAGYVLQDETVTYFDDASASDADARMETMSLAFASDDATVFVTGKQYDLGTDIGFRWIVPFPDMGAAVTAAAGETTLVASTAEPSECLPSGKVVPTGVVDVDIVDHYGLAVEPCTAKFQMKGDAAPVVAYYQRLLIEPPFTLEQYTIDLDDRAQQVAGALFKVRTSTYDKEELLIIVETNHYFPGQVLVTINWAKAEGGP